MCPRLGVGVDRQPVQRVRGEELQPLVEPALVEQPGLAVQERGCGGDVEGGVERGEVAGGGGAHACAPATRACARSGSGTVSGTASGTADVPIARSHRR